MKRVWERDVMGTISRADGRRSRCGLTAKSGTTRSAEASICAGGDGGARPRRGEHRRTLLTLSLRFLSEKLAREQLQKFSGRWARTDLRPDCTRSHGGPAHGPISPRVSGAMVGRCSCLEMDSSRSLTTATRNRSRTLTPETHREEEEEEDRRESFYSSTLQSFACLYSCENQ